MPWNLDAVMPKLGLEPEQSGAIARGGNWENPQVQRKRNRSGKPISLGRNSLIHPRKRSNKSEFHPYILAAEGRLTSISNTFSLLGDVYWRALGFANGNLTLCLSC